ncbi:MAG: hypothetical protein A3F10_00490 [Coxiella sp. RIFCSPHIGHO2_12_FULL_42_15]|nr:MAG: hypothetical protein A3F10_00490 [Coxiella sp. RIFCSPHIGHO2_12_FULL_42_15]
MSQAKIYVGNLSYDTTSADLDNLFSEYGAIVETKLITDRDTGRSKGFAFITFEQVQSAQDALALDGTTFQSRNIKVNMAKEGGTGGGGARRPGGQNRGARGAPRGDRGGDRGDRRW